MKAELRPSSRFKLQDRSGSHAPDTGAYPDGPPTYVYLFVLSSMSLKYVSNLCWVESTRLPHRVVRLLAMRSKSRGSIRSHSPKTQSRCPPRSGAGRCPRKRSFGGSQTLGLLQASDPRRWRYQREKCPFVFKLHFITWQCWSVWECIGEQCPHHGSWWRCDLKGERGGWNGMAPM